MATNKHAQIRYNVLDKCFSNFLNPLSYEELLEEVNKVLVENGTQGIKMRQLKYDIEFMCSDAGFSIELTDNLKHKKYPKQKVFRYIDKSFSLANHPLNQNESDQLEATLTILSRYKHRQEFSWLEEFIPRMELAFDLVNSGENSAISYQENIDLKGREHLGTLFNLIIKRKATKIMYEPYGKPKQEFYVHPYHLKQYNNRWFLFGYNPEFKSISNYPLDRIVKIQELNDEFEPSTINWMDYFEDIIGVTKPNDSKVENIKLKFSEDRINYALTKPLHGTQKLDKADESGCTITIEVIPNPELIQLLLSFGMDVKVLEPQQLKQNIKETIMKMEKYY